MNIKRWTVIRILSTQGRCYGHQEQLRIQRTEPGAGLQVSSHSSWEIFFVVFAWITFNERSDILVGKKGVEQGR